MIKVSENVVRKVFLPKLNIYFIDYQIEICVLYKYEFVFKKPNFKIIYGLKCNNYFHVRLLYL